MCDCINETHKSEIRTKYHTDLCITIPLKPGIVSKVIIKTEVAWDAPKRTKPIMLIASYCPFCGEKYQDKAEPAP
jgi:hypothetical protein